MSMTGQLAVTRPAAFWADAACRELPADWFYPERGASTSEAKAVCAACAVRPDCLRSALANNEHFGIWGGTSERERRRIRRRLTQGDPVAELAPEWTPTDRTGQPIALSPPPPPTNPEEPQVDLAAAAPAPTVISPNGTGPPIDPDTGRPTDVCVNCGRRYSPDRRTQRFCRKECARAWYAAHPRSEGGVGASTGKVRPPLPVRRRRRLATRDCEACGQPYEPGRKDQRFCSPACRAKHKNTVHYRPAAEARAEPPAVPLPVTTATAGPGVDVQALLGQLLATCDRWAIEADLGDIRVSVTRGCPARSA